MIYRVGRWLLLGMLCVGAWLAVREGGEHRQLLADYRRLRDLVGELQVENPEKIYVTVLKTNDPLYFVWRVYLPPEEFYRWESLTTHGSSSGTADVGAHEPTQSFIRCRLRIRDGQVEKFISRPGGSSYSTFGDADLVRRLKDPASQLRSVQFAADGPVEVDLNDVTTLLRLEFEESFRQEVMAELADTYRQELLEKPLIEFRFGTQAAFERAEMVEKEQP